MNIKDWLPLPPTLGPPLPAFLSIYWPWYTKAPTIGFSLKLRNPPTGAVLWDANFAENSFNYVPMADSGWLPIGSIWEYFSDPLGCTTLHIWILDAQNNILLNTFNLGPVSNGKNYIFDCSTQQLS